MPRSFSSCTPVVAYASLSLFDQGSDLDLLRRWTLTKPIEIEVLAEEVHPSESQRPFWNEILSEIERGAITTLIVPSLIHIAGNDLAEFSKFLTFLKIHGVALRSLKANINSRKLSRREIIGRAEQIMNEENLLEVCNGR